MYSLKKSFAAMTAAMSFGVMGPAQALPPVGQPLPLDQTLAALKAEQWEPVIVAGESVAAAANDGTVEGATPPLRKLFVVLSKQDSQQWASAVVIGDQIAMQADGKDMKLLPHEYRPSISVKYKNPQAGALHTQVQMQAPVPVPVPVQAADSACAPLDKIDELAYQKFGVVKVMEGSDESGAKKMGFYAGVKNQRWMVTVGDVEQNVSCMRLSGEGFVLSEKRPEFVPLWKRNMMNP